MDADSLQARFDQASSDTESSKLELLEIDFSGPTYSVEVQEGERSYFPFLQFDEQGKVKDAFCDCESEKELCSHLLLAYRSVKTPKGLYHRRYERSFFFALFFDLAAEYHASFDKKELGYKEGQLHFSARGFTLNVKAESEGARTFLDELFKPQDLLKESNSIKFCRLDEDELERWREGRPSASLRFELSPFAELAKRLYAVSLNSCKLKFTRQQQFLATFELGKWQLEWSFDFEHLDLYFKSLRTLPQGEGGIYWLDFRGATEALDYESETALLKICYAKDARSKKQRVLEDPGADIQGRWVYSDVEGLCYIGDPSLRWPQSLEGRQVAQLLDTDCAWAQSLLNVSVDPDPKEVRYRLHVDTEARLHLEAYLKEPQDLQEALFFSKTWVFIPEQGFIALKGLLFKLAHSVIERDEVSEFINAHKLFLVEHEGFEPQSVSIPGKWRFALDDEGNLNFYNAGAQESSKMRAFGQWLYVEGKGFYRHELFNARQFEDRFFSSVGDHLQVKKDQLSAFLKEVGPFLVGAALFDPQPQVYKMGLKAYYDRNELFLQPKFHWQEELLLESKAIVGEYSYVKGRGFHALPRRFALPTGYHEEKSFKGAALQSFLENQWARVEPHCDVCPDELRPATLGSLEAVKVSGVGAHFKVSWQFKTSRGTTGMELLLSALEKGKKKVPTPAGLVDVSEPRWRWLNKYVEQGQVLSPIDLWRIRVHFDPIEVLAQGAVANRLRAVLGDYEFLDPFPQTSVALWEYQRHGAAWLWNLYQQGLCGLLADEMGLGKTHQAMALMSAVAQKRGCMRALVLCPTSVIYHWSDKLAQYLPEVKITLFHGKGRSRDEVLSEQFKEDLTHSQVLITSYGILRREIDLFETLPFDFMIFDEIHFAKNPASQLHQAICQLKVPIRFALTGTPIENSLLDLKALFDLLMPGYLPEEAQFKKQFVGPVQSGNEAAKKQLDRFISPFLLRREKKQVLLELPDKIEEIAHCEMNREQKKLYEKVLADLKAEVMPQLAAGQNFSAPKALKILTALKQICNHPIVYFKNQEIPYEKEKWSSGKWDLFLELLDQALESGQKVVVFSQYLATLDMIKKELNRQYVGYSEIRGATQDRKGAVARFQKDPNCKVFIGSLNAAGVGIDLTAAQVVILYDRWWNPAKENQAIDRVHRIGQTKGVQVFKLSTLETIEAKIDQIIERKLKLLENLEADDPQDINWLSAEDLLEILGEG